MTKRPEKGLILVHESSKKTCMNVVFDKSSCILVCHSEECNNDDTVVYD